MKRSIENISVLVFVTSALGCSSGLDSSPAASGTEDPHAEDYGETAQDLQGSLQIDWSGCSTATVAQRSDITMALQKALALNQTVGASDAYESCITTSMTSGITLPSAPGGSTHYGPYSPSTFRWPEANGTYDNEWWHDPDYDYPQDVRVARAVSSLSSPVGLKLFCDQTMTGETAEIPTVVNGKPEEIRFGLAPALTLATAVKTATTAAGTWLAVRSHASLFMHDVAHDHSYAHPGWYWVPQDPIINTTHWKALNTIADSCMHELVTEMSGVCSTSVCGANQLPVPSSISSTTCVCVDNPRSTTHLKAPNPVGGPAAEFAADILGNVVALSESRNDVWFRSSTGTWTSIGGAAGHVFIAAGKVFATSPDNMTVYAYQSGVWSGLGSAQFFTVDVRGDAYRARSGNPVERLSSVVPAVWTSIGNPPGGASNLMAGGGSATRNFRDGSDLGGVGQKLYAIETSTGNIWRYSDRTWTLAGNPGAQFVVDSYGTVFGMNSAGEIYRNVDGQTWERVESWNSATSSVKAMAAGDRLYVKRSKRANSTAPWTDNVIEQLAPDMTWKTVGTGTDVQAAGKFVYTVDPATGSLMGWQD